MGIPYYFYVITKSYDGILLKSLPAHLKCGHLMLDFNGLIHPSAQKYIKEIQSAETKQPKDIEKGIMTAIWKDTEVLIKMVNPELTVQIYIDGVAPIAKMSQQRKRRFMSVLRKKMLNETSLWDTNAISPGTTFMTRLHASIRAHIRYSKEKFTYYFSSSDEVGEGEHKLFERIANKYNSPKEVKVIYGMDADLIMLSLFSHLPNIFLLRENQEVEGEYIYLNIDELRKGILKDLKNNYNWNISHEAISNPFNDIAKQVIESYGVACFLLGNDFIPHPVSLNLKKGGLEYILTQVGKLWNTIGIPLVDIKSETIQWIFMSQLLEILGQHENATIFDIVSEYYKKRAYTKDIEEYPLVNKDPLYAELLFKIDRKKWHMHYYKNLFHSNFNDTVIIMSSCDLYLKGILWTYLYYKRKPKDNEWHYPYAYAPTLRDVANYLNGHMPYYEGLHTTREWSGKDVFCTPIVQLLSILPRESADCLPIKYKKLMLENKSLNYLYPSTYKLQTFMKTKLWECSQVLPPMNVNLVRMVVESNK
jgi:5'-3' exonuclease